MPHTEYLLHLQETKNFKDVYFLKTLFCYNSSELESVLKKYGEPLTHRQSKELIALMDKNGDGQVDMDGMLVNFYQFYFGVYQLQG